MAGYKPKQYDLHEQVRKINLNAPSANVQGSSEELSVELSVAGVCIAFECLYDLVFSYRQYCQYYSPTINQNSTMSK